MAQRVLVADNTENGLEELKQILEYDGHEVYEVLTGDGVLKTLNVNNVPHLIILSSKLPELDTPDVIKEIKNDSRVKTVPILVLQDKGFEEGPFSALNVKNFLPKPVDKVALQNKVENLLKFGDGDVVKKSDPMAQMKFIGAMVFIAICVILLITVVFLPLFLK